MPSSAPDRTPTGAAVIYRFGPFEVRTESGELFRDSVKVPLQEQSLRILIALLERPGTVVSREQLRDRLWPEGTYVDFEHSLNAAVKRLRAALKDDADHPHCIQTLPRRGYRFILDVASAPIGCDDGASVSPPPEAPPELAVPSERRRLAWVAPALILLLLASTATMVTLYIRRLADARRRASVAVGDTISPTKNEAYELYLRSLTFKPEPPDNSQAIAMLERSTALDRDSARSWYELGRRYTFEHSPGGAGVAFLQKGREANRRALVLAPDFAPARLQQVILDVDVGQLGPAYNTAVAMIHLNPQDAEAHFALSLVLRSGGMFDESAAECDRALALDSSNPALRSCSMVLILLGRYDRASVFLDLDPISAYTRFRRLEIALLKNDKANALEIAHSLCLAPPLLGYPEARLVEAALSGAPRETVLDRSREAEALFDRINLPEAYFFSARIQSFAGQTQPAVRLLRRAITNNYCAYPAMDTDPLLANLRRLPEYPQLKQAGAECRENFRAQMELARQSAPTPHRAP